MPPSHELRGQLLRDGVFLDEPGQEPLAEETHQHLLVPCREGVERSVVRECADRLSLDTGSGRLRLVEVQARVVDADTWSGVVRLRLPRDASFELRADTGSGDVKSRFSDAEPIVRRREVIGYRRGDGDVKIDVDTGSGDVTVEPLS
jgi:DUF4097 and DUF4098 domain-containing protein YvlB